MSKNRERKLPGLKNDERYRSEIFAPQTKRTRL
ncbi:hypothetical protein Gohar_020611, partial [Gossypium harknessii]|nr:hypothetical protein [Gossypium harknessii]